MIDTGIEGEDLVYDSTLSLEFIIWS